MKIFFIIIGVLILAITSFVAYRFVIVKLQSKELDAISHTHEHKEQKATTNTTTVASNCGNCGMKSLDFPQWNVKVIGKEKDSNSQKITYFCSPRCLFVQATTNQTTYQSADSLLVVDYYNQQRIEARQAFFVVGSDVASPMGNDFVPLADEAAAKDFLNEHKGKKIVKFGEVNQENLLKLLQ